MSMHVYSVTQQKIKPKVTKRGTQLDLCHISCYYTFAERKCICILGSRSQRTTKYHSEQFQYAVTICSGNAPAACLHLTRVHFCIEISLKGDT